jgi:hypothetical protein
MRFRLKVFQIFLRHATPTNMTLISAEFGTSVPSFETNKEPGRSWARCSCFFLLPAEVLQQRQTKVSRRRDRIRRIAGIERLHSLVG